MEKRGCLKQLRSYAENALYSGMASNNTEMVVSELDQLIQQHRVL